MKKLLLKIILFFFLSLLFIIVGVDVSGAETISDNKVDELINTDTPKPNKEPSVVEKTVRFVGDYKYYILGGVLFFAVAGGVIASINVTPSVDTPPPILEKQILTIEAPSVDIPNIKSQMIEDLVYTDNRFTTSKEACQNFPDKIVPAKFYYHPPQHEVDDPKFIWGFIDEKSNSYFVFKIREVTAYDSITSESWINHTMTDYKIKFSQLPYDTTFLYTKVAVLPADNIHYNIYHKIDIVKLVPDPQGPHPALVTRVSVLYKDNEIGGAQ